MAAHRHAAVGGAGGLCYGDPSIRKFDDEPPVYKAKGLRLVTVNSGGIMCPRGPRLVSLHRIQLVTLPYHRRSSSFQRQHEGGIEKWLHRSAAEMDDARADIYPAAGLPVLAKQSGSTLVILNREPTDLDGVADLVLHREIGPTLGEAANVN